MIKSDVNEQGYSKCFGGALSALKDGKKVAREGWNGKNMYLFLVPDKVIKEYDGTEVVYGAYIAMKTADDSIVPWLCSQTDALSTDYYVL